VRPLRVELGGSFDGASADRGLRRGIFESLNAGEDEAVRLA